MKFVSISTNQAPSNLQPRYLHPDSNPRQVSSACRNFHFPSLASPSIPARAEDFISQERAPRPSLIRLGRVYPVNNCDSSPVSGCSGHGTKFAGSLRLSLSSTSQGNPFRTRTTVTVHRNTLNIQVAIALLTCASGRVRSATR